MHHRTVLITGGSRGIGAALAVSLAQEGAALVGIHYARDSAAAEAVAERVNEAGASSVLIRADLTDGAAGAALLAKRWREEVRRHGARGTDVLVSNAGINGAQSLSELDEGTVSRVFNVNLVAPLMLLHHLSDHINDHGRVIGISSGYARIAAPTHVAYTASKAGLETAFRAIAVELAERDITVNTVRPGVIDTDINADWINEPGARDAVASTAALGRVGQPEDVADIVAFRASNSSRWMTGQALDATGGTYL